ncbi:MAG: hypothetical protein Q8K51_14030, partial [Nitrospirota bacterium]|nr:hypothetical protein [Nitrospirota bacterium]
ARELGCDHGYVGHIRKLYNIDNPHRKPYGLLTKKQFLRAESLYLKLRSLKDIIKELKLPYKTIAGLYSLLRRKGVKRKGKSRAWIKFNPEKFRKLLNKNLNKVQIAKEMGIHEIQMYRYWGKYIKAIK